MTLAKPNNSKPSENIPEVRSDCFLQNSNALPKGHLVLNVSVGAMYKDDQSTE